MVLTLGMSMEHTSNNIERPGKFAAPWRQKEYGVLVYLSRNGVERGSEHIIISEYCEEHGFEYGDIPESKIYKVKVCFVAGHFGRFQNWFEQNKQHYVATRRPIRK